MLLNDTFVHRAIDLVIARRKDNTIYMWGAYTSSMALFEFDSMVDVSEVLSTGLFPQPVRVQLNFKIFQPNEKIINFRSSMGAGHIGLNLVLLTNQGNVYHSISSSKFTKVSIQEEGVVQKKHMDKSIIIY